MNETPLIIAARLNFKEIEELLILKGANINAKAINYLYIELLFFINLTSN